MSRLQTKKGTQSVPSEKRTLPFLEPHPDLKVLLLIPIGSLKKGFAIFGCVGVVEQVFRSAEAETRFGIDRRRDERS